MPFYEVIFEGGDHSILSTESDDEACSFAETQHARAKAGLPNGPAGDRADRVVRILVYDDDPGNPVTLATDKEVAARVKEVLSQLDTTEDGKYSLVDVALNLVPPAVLDTPVHESNYAAQESGELDPSKWGGDPR